MREPGTTATNIRVKTFEKNRYNENKSMLLNSIITRYCRLLTDSAFHYKGRLASVKEALKP